MKKLGLLFAVAVLLTSCLFDTDDSGVSSWLSTHGMPDSYKVQVLDIGGLKPVSVEPGFKSEPKIIDSTTFLLGTSSNVSYDMFLEFLFAESEKNRNKLQNADSLASLITFCWLQKLYKNSEFPKDSLPDSTSFDVNVGWKIEYVANEDKLKKLADGKDSLWLESLKEWEPENSADTVFKITYNSKDTSIVSLDLPAALMDDVKKMKYGARLQMKISVLKSERLYRFYGVGTKLTPYMFLFANDSSVHSFSPYRAANLPVNNEDCSDCPVVHGGGSDSIVIELPGDKILEAVQEAYKDSPLENKGEGYDVRQTVSLAQLTMARDDASGQSEFGLPIQVVVGSFVDSADTQVRKMESYRLNKNLILSEGHPNLIFHDGDSLSLQITQGVRDLVNKAEEGRNLRIVVKMGYPFLQEKDTMYTDYIYDGDTSRVFLNHFDHGRYDFSKTVENSMSLKLWMSSKRGDK